MRRWVYQLHQLAKVRRLAGQPKGFTIVEVLIVLAIAGVIMLVVFLAVPALQRNSRNTQRRADVSHLAGVINEWIGIHQGSTMTKFHTATSSAGPDLSNETFAQIQKPTQDSSSGYVASVTTATNSSGAVGNLPGTPSLDNFYVYSNAVCTNNTTPAYTSTAKSYIIVYYVEPGTTQQCRQT